MNWLLFLGGWLVGWEIIHSIIKDPSHIAMTFKNGFKITIYFPMIAWTGVWVWLIWRFV